MQYASEQDFFDYIESKDYLAPNEGVCFGYKVNPNTEADGYDVSLYFDD